MIYFPILIVSLCHVSLKAAEQKVEFVVETQKRATEFINSLIERSSIDYACEEVHNKTNELILNAFNNHNPPLKQSTKEKIEATLRMKIMEAMRKVCAPYCHDIIIRFPFIDVMKLITLNQPLNIVASFTCLQPSLNIPDKTLYVPLTTELKKKLIDAVNRTIAKPETEQELRRIIIEEKAEETITI